LVKLWERLLEVVGFVVENNFGFGSRLREELVIEFAYFE
jgi:hypothetical protein